MENWRSMACADNLELCILPTISGIEANICRLCRVFLIVLWFQRDCEIE
jgi:hypothetical protein